MVPPCCYQFKSWGTHEDHLSPARLRLNPRGGYNPWASHPTSLEKGAPSPLYISTLRARSAEGPCVCGPDTWSQEGEFSIYCGFSP